MKVISTNIGTKLSVPYRGKQVQTGIFKFPTNEGIVLETTDVAGDAVIDRKYHGGVDKAAYFFFHDNYSFWQNIYPELDFRFGFFGENVTLEGGNEAQIFIGEQYAIGDAIIEISQPREPCFKLGFRFGTQKVLKQFINQAYSGFYVRIVREGRVKQGDTLMLTKSENHSFSIAEAYRLLYQSDKDDLEKIASLIKFDALGNGFRGSLQKRIKNLES